MALAAAAWVLAGAIPAAASSFRRRENLIAILARIGRCVFAFALIVFGIQHFMYAKFLATLITSWIPGKLFWTYLTGVGMIAVALAIITGIYARFACLMLAATFFLWVLVLHAPLVAGAADVEVRSLPCLLARCRHGEIVGAGIDGDLGPEDGRGQGDPVELRDDAWRRGG